MIRLFALIALLTACGTAPKRLAVDIAIVRGGELDVELQERVDAIDVQVRWLDGEGVEMPVESQSVSFNEEPHISGWPAVPFPIDIDGDQAVAALLSVTVTFDTGEVIEGGEMRFDLPGSGLRYELSHCNTPTCAGTVDSVCLGTQPPRCVAVGLCEGTFCPEHPAPFGGPVSTICQATETGVRGLIASVNQAPWLLHYAGAERGWEYLDPFPGTERYGVSAVACDPANGRFVVSAFDESTEFLVVGEIDEGRVRFGMPSAMEFGNGLRFHHVHHDDELGWLVSGQRQLAGSPNGFVARATVDVEQRLLPTDVFDIMLGDKAVCSAHGTVDGNIIFGSEGPDAASPMVGGQIDLPAGLIRETPLPAGLPGHSAIHVVPTATGLWALGMVPGRIGGAGFGCDVLRNQPVQAVPDARALHRLESETWTQPISEGVRVIATHPSGALWLGSDWVDEGLTQVSEEGVAISRIEAPPSPMPRSLQHSLAFSADGEHVVLGTQRGEVWTSPLAETNWRELTSAASTATLRGVAGDGERVIAVGDAGTILRRVPGDVPSWTLSECAALPGELPCSLNLIQATVDEDGFILMLTEDGRLVESAFATPSEFAEVSDPCSDDDTIHSIDYLDGLRIAVGNTRLRWSLSGAEWQCSSLLFEGPTNALITGSGVILHDGQDVHRWVVDAPDRLQLLRNTVEPCSPDVQRRPTRLKRVDPEGSTIWWMDGCQRLETLAVGPDSLESVADSFLLSFSNTCDVARACADSECSSFRDHSLRCSATPLFGVFQTDNPAGRTFPANVRYLSMERIGNQVFAVGESGAVLRITH